MEILLAIPLGAFAVASLNAEDLLVSVKTLDTTVTNGQSSAILVTIVNNGDKTVFVSNQVRIKLTWPTDRAGRTLFPEKQRDGGEAGDADVLYARIEVEADRDIDRFILLPKSEPKVVAIEHEKKWFFRYDVPSDALWPGKCRVKVILFKGGKGKVVESDSQTIHVHARKRDGR
jgi:hypothetical protein